MSITGGAFIYTQRIPGEPYSHREASSTIYFDGANDDIDDARCIAVEQVQLSLGLRAEKVDETCEVSEGNLKRHRRTKAQIAADEAKAWDDEVAAKAAAIVGVVVARADEVAGKKLVFEDKFEDPRPLAVEAPAEPEVTDQDLLEAATHKSGQVGSQPIKDLRKKFTVGNSVSSIKQKDRPEFMRQLKALKKEEEL